MRLEDPRDLPRRTGHLQRNLSLATKLSARTFNASGVDATRPAERTFPSSQIATSQKSRCTSNPIALPTAVGRSHFSLLRSSNNERENRGHNDNDGYALAAQSGKSQGRPPKSTGSKPIVQNGLPSYVLPESPYPDRRTVSPDPDGALTRSFSCPEIRHPGSVCPTSHLGVVSAPAVARTAVAVKQHLDRSTDLRVGALVQRGRCCLTAPPGRASWQ